MNQKKKFSYFNRLLLVTVFSISLSTCIIPTPLLLQYGIFSSVLPELKETADETKESIKELSAKKPIIDRYQKHKYINKSILLYFAILIITINLIYLSFNTNRIFLNTLVTLRIRMDN